MKPLTQDMKDIAAKARTYILATASKDGKPNGVPIGLARILPDDEILLVATLMHKSLENICENPEVAVTYWSTDDHYGYQCKGKARVETSGEAYDAGLQLLKDGGSQSIEKAAVVVKVEEAYYIGRGKDSSNNLLQ